MARRAKADAEKTRARILANALSLFVKKGYANTTFNDIAAKLKMTKGAVYWHFASKSDLLIALVDEALDRFAKELGDRICGSEITYRSVAEMMIDAASVIISDPRRTEFFMLMQTGLKWSDETLAPTRERLLNERKGGPYHAFVNAIEADKAAGLVRKEVSAGEMASASMAIWEGLLQRKIEGFLLCDMPEAIRHAFNAVWDGIKVAKVDKKGGRK